MYIWLRGKLISIDEGKADVDLVVEGLVVRVVCCRSESRLEFEVIRIEVGATGG